ncbi:MULTISPECIES: TetR family transcriptional regulator [unclassified Actinoplanes]|uniref:TetR family transcriptional regulator n=1 Tax=unclassified Actinoplanes TaxID=2626549 RepID=UPI0018D42778|nr:MULTISPECIES: TetR family transcriptional regulator [unclassified Actinoplanes]
MTSVVVLMTELEDATIRRVAAEAGVPARQLQYYFGTRDDLLLGALELLNRDGRSVTYPGAGRRWVTAVGSAAGPYERAQLPMSGHKTPNTISNRSN